MEISSTIFEIFNFVYFKWIKQIKESNKNQTNGDCDHLRFFPFSWILSTLWWPSKMLLREMTPGTNFMKLGMSSLFINLILKTSHYLHMKVLNERISKWAQLSFYNKWFSRYVHLKFEKEMIFLGRFSPMKFQKVGTKSLISELSKLLFK